MWMTAGVEAARQGMFHGLFSFFFHFPQCQHMGDGGRVGDGVGGWFFVFFLLCLFIYLFAIQ